MRNVQITPLLGDIFASAMIHSVTFEVHADDDAADDPDQQSSL